MNCFVDNCTKKSRNKNQLGHCDMHKWRMEKYGSYDLPPRDRSKTYNDIVRMAKDKPCADCGAHYPYYVMDFDHLPKFQKEFNIGERGARRFPAKKLLAEIAKCEVVCSNCHRIRTFTRH